MMTRFNIPGVNTVWYSALALRLSPGNF
jgi:hypothetical protein